MSDLFDQYKDEGNVFFKNGQFTQAVQSYDKCINLETWNPVGYSNKAMALIKLKDYQLAMQVCSQGLSKLNMQDSKHITLKKKLDYRLEMASNLLVQEQSITNTTNEEPSGPVNLTIKEVDMLPAEFLDL